jgi:hypothetical protein
MAACPNWCKVDHEHLYTQPGEHARRLTPPVAVLTVTLLRQPDGPGGRVVLDFAFGENGIGQLPPDPMTLVKIAHDLLEAAETLSAIAVEEAW